MIAVICSKKRIGSKKSKPTVENTDYDLLWKAWPPANPAAEKDRIERNRLVVIRFFKLPETTEWGPLVMYICEHGLCSEVYNLLS